MTDTAGREDGLIRGGACDACGHAFGWDANVCERCGASFDPAAHVPVFVTADAQLLPLLKSALEVADVPFAVQGEGALGLFPLGALATGLTRNLLAATILVPRARAVEALGVLAGLDEPLDESPDEEAAADAKDDR